MVVQGLLAILLVYGVLVGVVAQHPGCTTPPAPFDNSTCPATALPRVMESVNLSIAKWIWTGENAVPRGDNPIGPRAFRKNFTSACGKCAISAKILIAADNEYKLFVNGHAVGSGSSFTNADVYYTALEPASNLFAIEATNTGGPAGLTAAILVQYSDGSSETVITDETWRTVLGSPKDFQLPTVDDRIWSFAAFQGQSGVAPWGKTVIPQALDIANSSFIWVGKQNNRTGQTSKGSRAFRKTIVTPGCTKRAVAANVLLNVDNELAFFVNGQKVEWRQHWWIGRAYYIPRPTLRPDVNVFAVNGTNGGGPASVIATIHISYDDGTFDIIRTDETWKASLTVPNDFASPTLDDSAWTNATNLGFWGRKPWRQIKFPKA
uniref:Lectin 3 n=1 Tax=Pleurotus ostreatus TaxID=5322 RepID=A0A3S8XGB6_PLEOS|nr:lectin 3 [Pleurotus ostreatus]